MFKVLCLKQGGQSKTYWAWTTNFCIVFWQFSHLRPKGLVWNVSCNFQQVLFEPAGESTPSCGAMGSYEPWFLCS